MADWYVSSAGYAAVTTWSAAQVVALNVYRRPTAPSAGNERVYKCTTAGTTGGSEPSWPLGSGATVNDNGVIWTEVTGTSANQSAGNWTAPAATLDLIIGTSGRASAAGLDNVFVADNHSESWASARTWNRLNYTVCVTVAGSALPPVAASVSTGAVVTTTGANSLTLSATGYFYGVTFNVGTGSSAASLVIGSSAAGGTATLERCAINLVTTSASSRITLGATAVLNNLILNNTTISFGAAGQGITATIAGCFFGWYNTPTNGLQGTSPTNLFIVTQPPLVEISGVDLSNLAGNIVQSSAGSNSFQGQVRITGCKLNTATVLAANLRTASRGQVLQLNCSDDTTGNNIARQAYGAPAATGGVVSNTRIYRNGGAAAGTGNGFSLAMIATSSANGPPTYQLHPVTPPIFFWNTTIGSSRTVTVNMLANKSALPTNAMLWLEVQYMAASTSPQLTLSNGGPLPLATASPTNLSATTEDWDDGVPARANTTAYAVGDEIKVASNPGRVFFCTTAGTSNGTEPAGYASAVDGGSVTDNTAVFRAGYRCSAALTFTPDKEGWFSVYVHLVDSQATVTNVYVDPIAVVT